MFTQLETLPVNPSGFPCPLAGVHSKDPMDFDSHGQPYGAVGASRREVHDLCEMMGMVKGVLT